jgi:hypothetical protein
VIRDCGGSAAARPRRSAALPLPPTPPTGIAPRVIQTARDGQHVVAVPDGSRVIDGDEPVAVAVEGEADGGDCGGSAAARPRRSAALPLPRHPPTGLPFPGVATWSQNLWALAAILS